MIFKKILSLILSLLLMIHPAYGGNSALSQYSKRENLTINEYLIEGLKKTKNKRDRAIIQNALGDLQRDTALKNLKVGSSLDAIFYMLLSYREKDFIQFPNVYKFYKAIRSQIRGMNIAKFNKYCVYKRDSILSYKYFSFADFVENKSFGCRRPKLLNSRVSPEVVFAFMEKQIKINLKKMKKQRYSFNPLNLFIGNAHAISLRRKIGGGILVGVGVALGVAGVMFSITLAGVLVGGPLIIAGAAAGIAGSAILLTGKDKPKPNNNNDGN